MLIESLRLLQGNTTLNGTDSIPEDVHTISNASLVLAIVLPIVGAAALVVMLTCLWMRRGAKKVIGGDIENRQTVQTMTDLVPEDDSLKTKYRRYGET